MPARSRTRLALLRLAGGVTSPSRPSRAGDLRVLVIRPDHIGDLVFMSPALSELRSALPQAHLTLSVGPWGAGTAELLPQVDRVEQQLFPGFQRGPKPPLAVPYAQAARLAAHWTGRYDVCIIARPDHWWGAMTASFAGIPNVFGWSTPETVPFLTDALPTVEGRHEVATNLALLRHVATALGATVLAQQPIVGKPPLRLEVPVAAARSAEEFIARAVGPGREYACVHPGAGAPTKLWPHACYRAVIRELHDRTGLPVLVTGSLAEADLAESIAASSMGALPTPGEFSVPELAWVMAQARVCIGSDSGPLHLAAGLGGRTVHIFGPADEAKFGPWSAEQNHRILSADVPCRPCGDLSECRVSPPLVCMSGVSEERVLAAAMSLL